MATTDERAQAESLWLRPPRLRTADEVPGERRASWLEIFFDLVFVVAITELAHELVLEHSAAGFLRFAALFVPVFVAWQGFSAYADRFDSDDLALRLAFFYAHLPLLLALAGLGAGVRLLIDEAGADHLERGTAAAFLGSIALFLVSLVGTRWVTVTGARNLGIAAKSAAVGTLAVLGSQRTGRPIPPSGSRLGS